MRRNRQEKYPDTAYFHYHNQNPHNRITTDCVIRAISRATGINYNDVVMDFAKMQCETGFDPSEKDTFDKYLKTKGWVKMKEPRKSDNTKYLVYEFLQKYPNTTCIANVGSHHVAAIVDGVVNDIWNSSYQTMHTYWVKA